MSLILVAEDNVMVGLLMQTDLEDAGHEVMGPFARNRECLAAIAAAKEDGKTVDLALLDIDLAGGDSGIALAEEIKKDGELACLFVTGQSEEAHGAEKLALGILGKPFQSRDLIAAVTEALAADKREREPVTGVSWFG